MKVRLIVQGYNDSTKVVLEVDKDQLDFLREISDLVTESAVYRSQPILDLIEDYEEVEND